MQSLRHGPEGVFAVRGFDQDDARRIKAEAVEAMAARAALFALPIGRDDEEEGAARRLARQHRHGETKGGRKGARRVRHDLMQGAAGQAALRQMGIEREQAEGQGAVDIVRPGKHTPQTGKHSRTRSRCHLGAVLRQCGFNRRDSRVGH